MLSTRRLPPLRPRLLAPTPNAARINEVTAKAAVASYSDPAQAFSLNPRLSAGATGSWEEALLRARAVCKFEARKFAMLFDPDWHTRLFRQLDMLMDVEEWDPADMPVTRDSFATLLRLLMILRRMRRPGVGIAYGGNIVATWSIDSLDRLAVECLPNDRVRWIVTRRLEEGSESAAGETILDRLIGNLKPYNPEHWLAHEGTKPSE